ncbi:MAG: hypothetical protein Kow00106_17560 [Anaerolineae bacterium]
MSDYAWLGVIVSSFVSTLALASYAVMALPYFDNMPYLTELRRDTRKAVLAGLVAFAVFFTIFYLGAQYLDETTSGPLLLMAAFVVGLPFSLLLGSETWDRYNARGMNAVPGLQAVMVATGIGLAEIVGFTLVFIAFLQLT